MNRSNMEMNSPRHSDLIEIPTESQEENWIPTKMKTGKSISRHTALSFKNTKNK